MKKTSKKNKIIILTAIALIIVIIGILIGTNAIKINILTGKFNSANNNQNNGNLLPEYIKAGITLGGVTGTLEDLDTSDATATAMDIAYGKTAYVDGKKIDGLFVKRESLKVGDFVDYKPDQADAYSLQAIYTGHSSNQSITQEDLKWQVFNINDDGTVDLISENATNQTIYFFGSLGYNNGVFFLNDICKKLYSNNNLKIIGRSIKREDIEKHLSEEGINQIYNFNNGADSYGKQRTYYTYIYYPKLYSLENGSGINTTNVKTDGISFSDSYYTEPTTNSYARASSSLTGVSTAFGIANNINYYDSNTSYNIIQNGKTYWIATRYTSTSEYGINWGLLLGASNGTIRCSEVRFGSQNNGTWSTVAYCIRPVVTIPSNIILYGGDGSTEHPYQLLIE